MNEKRPALIGLLLQRACWLFLFACLVISMALWSNVLETAVSVSAVRPTVINRQPVSYFAPGHTEADARTVVAMFRYLLSRETSLSATNQVPVSG